MSRWVTARAGQFGAGNPVPNHRFFDQRRLLANQRKKLVLDSKNDEAQGPKVNPDEKKPV